MWKTVILLGCGIGGLLATPIGIKNMPIVAEAPMENRKTEIAMSTLNLPSNATSIRADITDGFTCTNKTYGYYADVENECQIFHVCLPVVYPDGRENTFRWSFICPEETLFSQESFTCMRGEDMNFACDESERFYDLNRNFGMSADSSMEMSSMEADLEEYNLKSELKSSLALKPEGNLKEEIVSEAIEPIKKEDIIKENRRPTSSYTNRKKMPIKPSLKKPTAQTTIKPITNTRKTSNLFNKMKRRPIRPQNSMLKENHKNKEESIEGDLSEKTTIYYEKSTTSRTIAIPSKEDNTILVEQKQPLPLPILLNPSKHENEIHENILDEKETLKNLEKDEIEHFEEFDKTEMNSQSEIEDNQNIRQEGEIIENTTQYQKLLSVMQKIEAEDLKEKQNTDFKIPNEDSQILIQTPNISENYNLNEEEIEIKPQENSIPFEKNDIENLQEDSITKEELQIIPAISENQKNSFENEDTQIQLENLENQKVSLSQEENLMSSQNFEKVEDPLNKMEIQSPSLNDEEQEDMIIKTINDLVNAASSAVLPENLKESMKIEETSTKSSLDLEEYETTKETKNNLNEENREHILQENDENLDPAIEVLPQQEMEYQSGNDDIKKNLTKLSDTENKDKLAMEEIVYIKDEQNPLLMTENLEVNPATTALNHEAIDESKAQPLHTLDEINESSLPLTPQEDFNHMPYIPIHELLMSSHQPTMFEENGEQMIPVLILNEENPPDLSMISRNSDNQKEDKAKFADGTMKKEPDLEEDIKPIFNRIKDFDSNLLKSNKLSVDSSDEPSVRDILLKSEEDNQEMKEGNFNLEDSKEISRDSLASEKLHEIVQDKNFELDFLSQANVSEDTLKVLPLHETSTQENINNLSSTLKSQDIITEKSKEAGTMVKDESVMSRRLRTDMDPRKRRFLFKADNS